VVRESKQVEPIDLLIGVAELRHSEECEFRHLFVARAELASKLGIPALPEDAVSRFRALKRKIALSKSSAVVLRLAASEADRGHQFWIDNDHLQIALALHNAKFDTALRQLGYSVDHVRQLGDAGRLKNPPRKPSLRVRAQMIPTVVWVIVGVLTGLMLVNLYNLSFARLHP